jgi:hypothetical protein
MSWIDMARVAIAPTLDADDLRCRGLKKIDEDAGEARVVRRPRARVDLGEPVCAGTIYGRVRRARLKAARENGSG